MADEPKSRLTNLVGLITAVTGLIAALVALSGALKSHFTAESNNSTAAAITTNAAAPMNAPAGSVVAAGPAGQRRVAGGAALPSVTTAPGRSAGPGVVQVDRATNSGGSQEMRTETTHVEPQTHSAEPDPTPEDDSSPPEGE